MKINKYILFILCLALILRLFNINWDNSNHLHPDERFLTMVVSSVSLKSLNPADHGFDFYVYGTFPLLITRTLGQITHYTSYDKIFLIGRFLSTIFDVGTCYLIFLISNILFKKKSIALWAAFFYAIAVFPIQQAHFFTVDSFTVFFSTISIYFLLKKNYLLSGFLFGLTLACKMSLIIILPFLLLFIFNNQKKNKIFEIIKFLIMLFISFRIFQPYAFIGLFNINPLFIKNISTASKMITGEIDYPPNIQWAYTVPLIHPLINIFLVGLGPVLTIFSIISIFVSKFKHKSLLILVISSIFVYQGFQLAKYMRYFYPFYPYLCIFAAAYFVKLKPKKLFLILITIPTILFMTIYMRPNSRVTASKWITDNIPKNKTLTAESWDDALPLQNPGYKVIYLDLYNEDNEAKWDKLSLQLSQVDYLIISSNRLLKSIPRMPQRYPITSIFYKKLLNNETGFLLIKKIYSYPIFNDELVEESFSVYDHPVIYIFKKQKSFVFDYTKNIPKAIYLNPSETSFNLIDKIKQWIF